MMIKAIIIDLDGTLIDSPKIALDTFVGFLEEKKLEAPKEKILEIAYKSHVSLLKEILEMNKKKYTETMAEGLRIEYIKKIRKVQLFPYAVELLEALKGKSALVLATMSSDRTTDIVLDQNDLRKYFDIIVSRDTHDVDGKLQMFECILQDLKIKGNECIIIEDSQYGLDSGKSLGMTTIGIRHISNNIKSDIVVDNLDDARKEALKIIKKVE